LRTRQLSRPKLRLLGAGRLAQQRVACRGALGRENDSPVTQRCRSQINDQYTSHNLDYSIIWLVY